MPKAKENAKITEKSYERGYIDGGEGKTLEGKHRGPCGVRNFHAHEITGFCRAVSVSRQSSKEDDATNGQTENTRRKSKGHGGR